MREPKSPVGVLKKTFAVLSCFSSKPEGMTLTEISELTKINKSTAHRLLSQMESEGFLQRSDNGRYLIGHRLFQLATHATQPLELRTAASPVMTALVRNTGETANLAILDRSEIVILHVVESPHEFRMAAKIGGRRPFHTTALGKAMAAFLNEDKLNALLENCRLPLEAPTPHTIQDLYKLREKLGEVRATGYAVDNEETVVGVRAVASPIFNSQSEMEGAISISGPVSRITDDRTPSIASSVIDAAKAITRSLGGSSNGDLTLTHGKE